MSDEQCPEGRPGEGVVGLRPESLSILGAGQSGARQISARVIERVYYGDMTYYEIEPAGTQIAVSVSTRNMPGRPVHAPGDQITLAWDPDALTYFP